VKIRLLSVFVSLSVAAALAIAAAPSAGAAGPVPSSNGRLAYASYEDGDYDIYTVNPDGTDLQNLTGAFDDHSPGVDCCDDSNPAWSPDGTKLAFNSNREGKFEIWVMDADGANQVRLTTSPGGTEAFDPAWSPEGTRISYTMTADYVEVFDWDIHVMDADGSNDTDITSPNQTLEYMDSGASWAPDGSRIVFTGVREGAYEILSVLPDGSDELNLTSDDVPTYANINDMASYSPDGTTILYASQPNDGSNDWDLWTMNPDGSNKVAILPDDEWEDLFPSWSPDGTQIIFASNRGEFGQDVFVMDYPPAPALTLASATVAGSTGTKAVAVHQVTSNGKSNSPSWQPVPATVTFLQARLSGAKVSPTVGDPDGSGRAQLQDDLVVGSLCYEVKVAGIQLPAKAVLFRGPAGTVGRKVVSLGSIGFGGSVEGCLTGLSARVLDDLAQHPDNYYVQVANGEFRGGALRGQVRIQP
jgi:Tol biopolymer transport system component